MCAHNGQFFCQAILFGERSTWICEDYTICKDRKYFEVGVIYCFFHHIPPQYLAFSIYEHMQVQTVARVG